MMAMGGGAGLVAALEAARLHALTRTDAGRRPVTDALLAARGRHLRHLLAAMDYPAGGRDLERVVFSYLDETQREAVLAHIGVESAAWPGAVRVVVDIDDTLFASLHDRVYPHGVLYPGALAFLTRCGGPTKYGRGGAPLTVVTARPEMLEPGTWRQLTRLGVPALAVLSGSVTSVATDGAMADRKAVNVEHLLVLHPKDRLVLVGDDGQGDLDLARQALAEWPSRVAAVFIHHVASAPPSPVAGVTFFDNYVDAAAQAAGLGLLQPGDVTRVAHAAHDELAGLRFADPAREWAARDAFNQTVMRLGHTGLVLPLPALPDVTVTPPAY